LKLNDAAHLAGKLYFGTAVDNANLNDSAYVKILNDDAMFGQITAENSMKWEFIEPSPGVFNFTDGDVIASLATKFHRFLRGHNCVWHNQLPDWVNNGVFTNQSMLETIVRHCSTLVNHYKGKVFSWDVVNEPLNEDGTLQENVFFNASGASYISTALRSARAADPHAKLYINEFNLEFFGPKFEGMLSLVKTLLEEHVPLDGIGFQCHLIVDEVPPELALNMANFTALGLEVAVTELDIRMNLPVTDALLEQQKTDYDSVISACTSVKGCVGVTVWDFNDAFSWVPGTFAGQGAACPWDQNLVRKPAYDGIVAGFTQRSH